MLADNAARLSDNRVNLERHRSEMIVDAIQSGAHTKELWSSAATTTSTCSF